MFGKTNPALERRDHKGEAKGNDPKPFHFTVDLPGTPTCLNM